MASPELPPFFQGVPGKGHGSYPTLTDFPVAWHPVLALKRASPAPFASALFRDPNGP